jgi:hypothetical protein
MAQDRNIHNATPALQEAWAHVQAHWDVRWGGEVRPVLVEVHRSAAVQRAYYAQGRQNLSLVNNLRKAAGLAPIGAEENRNVVTYRRPGRSKHEKMPSEAIDILIMKGRIIVNDPAWYRRLADMMRSYNHAIIWGGDWDGDQRSDDERFVDMPHFEI